MATGIVSIAAHFEGIEWLAFSLFILNIIFFSILVCLNLARLFLFPKNIVDDFTDFSRGVGFFTVIAGTCLLGNQFVIIQEDFSIAIFLLIFALILWIFLIYGIFTVFLVKKSKPTLDKGINGGWLVSIVATQAISVLASLLSSQFGIYEGQILFVSLSMWLFGGMLYIWIIMLIFQRYFFYQMDPSDLTPPYWINMGAVAITTLAGDVLIENADSSLFLQTLIPFLKGFTLFFWATATWWIPMLIILGIWRHIYKKFKLTYDPQYWGAVFPLGMYTVCTFRLSKALDLNFLSSISDYFIYIAILAWLATFIGLLHSILKNLIANFTLKQI